MLWRRLALIGLIPVVALVLTRASAAQGAAAAQDPDSVIEKFLAASGGRDAISKLTSRRSTGTVAVSTPAGDIQGTIQIEGKAQVFRGHGFERKLGGDTHHNVGVINRSPVLALTPELHRFVAKIVAKLREHVRMRSLRKRGVSQFVHVIQDKTPRAFERAFFALRCGVIDHVLDQVMLPQFIDHVVPTLPPARRGIHWIKRDPSVVMRREPVVRENGVGLVWRRGVIDDVHRHAGGALGLHRLVKLLLGRR